MEAIKKIEINRIVKIILIAIAGTLLLTLSSKIKNTGIEIEDISTDEGNLEDVFIDLTKN